MVKNVPNSKNIYFTKFYVLYLILSDFIQFFEANHKLLADEHKMIEVVEDGENVLAGKQQFYLLEMLLIKYI